MTTNPINLNWIQWHGKETDRLVEITVQDLNSSINLGLYEWEHCIMLAEHLREIADELDPQENNQ